MSSAPRVNILISVYNGEKYLAAQLDSLFAQTYRNITVYIRDDGSKDNSLSIIRTYMQRGLSEGIRLVLLENAGNRNLGYMESFWTLLRESGQADYYAFCDQDDYWLPEKVEKGVAALEKEDADRPLLYSSSFYYCDAELHYSADPQKIKTPVRFKDVLFYTPAFGFTIMINHTLRNLALSASSLAGIPHDGWCQKIAASMGKFIYDPARTAGYRRHSSTVTYAGAGTIKMIAKWIRNDLFGAGLSEQRFVLERFYEEYGDRLGEKEYAWLNLFRERPVTAEIYLKRLFFPERLRPSIGGEMALRGCFLGNR